MNNSNERRAFLVTRLSLAMIFMVVTLLFTRFGVFLVFDVLADIGANDTSQNRYEDAPVVVTKVLSDPDEIVLPAEIEQVSGLIMLDDKLIVSTDQSEIFALDMANPAQFEGGNLFPFIPLLMRQGRLEAVTWAGNAFRLVGEYGAFIQVNDALERADDVPLPGQIAEYEFSGLATGPQHFYFTADGENDLMRVARSTDQVSQISLNFGTLSKPEGSVTDLRWSGVAYDDGLLYLSADTYPIIVVASAVDGQVTDVLGVDEPLQFSDVAVNDGQVFLPQDHNLFDERPPLLIFDLP